jgi:lactoylglutathione lyase
VTSIFDKEAAIVGRRTLLGSIAGVAGSVLIGKSALGAEGNGIGVSAEFIHVPTCVSNLERSTRFYIEVFGFEKRMKMVETGGALMNKMMELEGTQLKAQMIGLGGLQLELLEFVSPPSKGPNTRRAMNQLGLGALAFRVKDLEGILKAIRDHGGAVVDQSRIQLSGPDSPGPATIVFCTDPDGTRLELVKM